MKSLLSVAILAVCSAFAACKQSEDPLPSGPTAKTYSYKGYGKIDCIVGGCAYPNDTGATLTYSVSADSVTISYKLSILALDSPGVARTDFQFRGSPGRPEGIYTLTTLRTYAADSMEVAGYEQMHGPSTLTFYFRGKKTP